MDTIRYSRIHDHIKNIVELKQGLKATELAVELFIYGEEWIDVMNRMIKEGELVEVEYVLPALSYRAKSFILPADTQVVIRTGDKP